MNIERVEVQYNSELFRVLCIRAMTKDITFEQLLNYAVSFVNRRLVTGNMVVRTKNISHEDMIVHTFYAWISMS